LTAIQCDKIEESMYGYNKLCLVLHQILSF